MTGGGALLVEVLVEGHVTKPHVSIGYGVREFDIDIVSRPPGQAVKKGIDLSTLVKTVSTGFEPTLWSSLLMLGWVYYSRFLCASNLQHNLLSRDRPVAKRLLVLNTFSSTRLTPMDQAQLMLTSSSWRQQSSVSR